MKENQRLAMETLTVCTYLTETPADQTRELSNDQKSRLQFGIGIEVGKAVISINSKSKKKIGDLF